MTKKGRRKFLGY